MFSIDEARTNSSKNKSKKILKIIKEIDKGIEKESREGRRQYLYPCIFLEEDYIKEIFDLYQKEGYKVSHSYFTSYPSLDPKFGIRFT